MFGSEGSGSGSRISPWRLSPTEPLSKSKKEFNRFVNTIKTEGIKEPICYVEHNGTKYVVDGHHRLLAAKMLGLDNVPTKKVELPYKGYSKINDLIGYCGP
ncbi:MAG: hypothetical protein K0S29_777 [Gammaproteobacteria bacterium]|nr:hypothetical protein [Gammaproteobacteria bacterium]